MVTESQLSALCCDGKEGLYLNIHAQPGARRPQLCGLHGDAVKIAIGEAAQDGKANKAIISLLAKSLRVPSAAIEITSGLSARRKRILLRGEPADLKQKILDWLNTNA